MIFLGSIYTIIFKNEIIKFKFLEELRIINPYFILSENMERNNENIVFVTNCFIKQLLGINYRKKIIDIKHQSVSGDNKPDVIIIS